MPRYSAVSALLLAGCAVQPAYQRPALDLPAAWHNGARETAPAPAADAWWTRLEDPAIDALVATGLQDNPTLAQAAARVDQARAVLAVRDAGRLPAVTAQASVSHSRDGAGTGGAAISLASAAIGPRLSWEIDLWGRIREGRMAARHRLGARTADADGARLAVIGGIADTALGLRACILTLAIRDRDIASREAELAIARQRLALGNVAPTIVATARSNLGTVRTERILQQESCRRLVDALVTLSGADAAMVERLVTDENGVLPEPPSFAPDLPATILLAHPAVIAAEREVAARWSEIGVARAERLPRLDLTAALTGQWIRALGSSDVSLAHSVGAGLSAPLFEGGAGRAQVRGAEAAYREAVAQRTLTLRGVIRDIEDGLAAHQSARARIATTAEGVDAARFALGADEARARAGAIAPFELEESRRQLRRAEEAAILAASDRARTWVALVRLTGPAQPAEADRGTR